MILKALIFFFIQFVFFLFFSGNFLYALFMNIIFSVFVYAFLFFIKSKILYLLIIYLFSVNFLLDTGGLKLFYSNTMSLITLNPFNEFDYCFKRYCSTGLTEVEEDYKDYKITDGLSDYTKSVNYSVSRKIYEFNYNFLLIKYVSLLFVFLLLILTKNKFRFILYYVISAIIITFEYAFCFALYYVLKYDKFVGPNINPSNYVLINILLTILTIAIGRKLKNENQVEENNSLLFIGFIGVMYSLIIIGFEWIR